MIFLWILLGILLFLCALILLPVSIKIGYAEEVTLSVGTLGLYFPILPKKPKKAKPMSRREYKKRLDKDLRLAEKKRLAAEKKAQKKQSAKLAKQSEADKKLPASEMKDEPSAIRIVLRIVSGVLDTFFGKLRVKIARVHIVVGGPDAAKTAITYGIVSQGVAYLMELISYKTKMTRARNTYVSVVPDFLAKTTTADLLIIFRLRLIDLLSTGIVFVIRFMKEKTASAPKKQ